MTRQVIINLLPEYKWLSSAEQVPIGSFCWITGKLGSLACREDAKAIWLR